MTQAEYRRLYIQAQKQTAKITQQVRREILKSYREAADLAAEAVRATTQAGLSDLTSAGWTQINGQLQAGADIVSRSTELNTPLGISKAYKNYADIDTEYIDDAVRASGTTLITQEGIRSIVVGIDNALIQATATRIYSDGYTFSDRIWKTFNLHGKPVGVNGDYQYRVKNLILTGQAQGRDNIDIAKDIQLYVSRGKSVVFREGRYGRLIPGTREYYNRITGTVDWRALRLVRSELGASMQTAGRLEGVMNPACRDLYNWHKNSGNPIDPSGERNASGLRCIDLEDGNPYTLENVPSFQHPNCSCAIIPVLMDQTVFVNDLKEWDLASDNYLTQWYRDVYIPGQSGSISI